MDSIIKLVLDSNWTELNKYTEKRAAEKIIGKIEDKKKEVIDVLNSNMSEIINK